MEKMSKIAKHLDVFLNVAYQIGRAAVCVLAACMILLPVVGESMMMTDGFWTIELGCVSLEVADGVMPENGFMMRLEAGMLYAALAIAVGCYLLKLTRSVVKPMVEMQPFHGETSGMMRKLSFAVLIGGGLLSVAQMAGEAVISRMCGFETLFLSDKIVGVELEYTLDMGFVLVFAVLHLLSFVFRYGEELQKQSDETL